PRISTRDAGPEKTRQALVPVAARERSCSPSSHRPCRLDSDAKREKGLTDGTRSDCMPGGVQVVSSTFFPAYAPFPPLFRRPAWLYSRANLRAVDRPGGLFSRRVHRISKRSKGGNRGKFQDGSRSLQTNN